MKVDEVVRELNLLHGDSRFRGTLLGAKRDARRREGWCVVEVSVRGVTLFEAIPPGRPLCHVAKRVGWLETDIIVRTRWDRGKWRIES